MKKILLFIMPFLLFLSCEPANKTVEKVEHPTNSQPKPIARTNIRLADKKENYKELETAKRLATADTKITSQYFQMEGPAWENENVAFRNYFDARNGIDIFGKRKKEMLLDKVGIDGNYHELADWGMDILKVGNSLGAGAIGMIVGDSLYRIGGTGEGTYRRIAETPTESSFVLSFPDSKIQGRKYAIDHTITISAGTHFYKSKVRVKGLKGDETLVSGIVAHMDKPTKETYKNYTIMATHGVQSEDKSNLGMALAVPNSHFLKISKSEDYKGASVDHTHLLEMKFGNGDTVEFYFFTGWELQDGKFKEASYFMNTIKKELDERF